MDHEERQLLHDPTDITSTRVAQMEEGRGRGWSGISCKVDIQRRTTQAKLSLSLYLGLTKDFVSPSEVVLTRKQVGRNDDDGEEERRRGAPVAVGQRG